MPILQKIKCQVIREWKRRRGNAEKPLWVDLVATAGEIEGSRHPSIFEKKTLSVFDTEDLNDTTHVKLIINE